MPDPTPTAPTLHLARWTVTSGSNAQSRGAVIIDAGDHHWRASAEGNGAIDALYRAVDKALAEILDGHPRLLAYDIHALGEGTDTIGVVTVRIAPPDVGGERGTGEYGGEARGPNIIAASIEAYIVALNAISPRPTGPRAPATAAAGKARGRGRTARTKASTTPGWFQRSKRTGGRRATSAAARATDRRTAGDCIGGASGRSASQVAPDRADGPRLCCRYAPVANRRGTGREYRTVRIA